MMPEYSIVLNDKRPGKFSCCSSDIQPHLNHNHCLIYMMYVMGNSDAGYRLAANKIRKQWFAA